MHRLALRLLMLAPLAAAIVSTNLIVDYAGLFHSGQEQEIARLLAADRNVEVDLDTFDHRIMQRDYINRLAAAPEWAVFGSSRAGLAIDRRMVGGTRLFNHVVSGATVEDLLAMTAMYARRDMMPRHVVLTVDPWILNRSNSQIRWQSTRDEYEQMARILNVSIDHAPSVFYVSPLTARRTAELFSFSYFQACLRQVLYASGARSYPVATNEDQPGVRAKIMADGSWQYPRFEHSRTPEEVNDTVRSGLYAEYSLKSFTRIDPERQRALERLVAYLTARGSDVTLLLIPYHPLEYQRLIDAPEGVVVNAVEQYVRELAAASHARFAGSYNPNRLGCQSEEFLDGIHPTRSCMQRATQALLTIATAEASRE